MSKQFFHSLRQEYRLIGSLADLGVWYYNLDTDELFWDEEMFVVYGVKPEDFNNSIEDWKACTHPEDREPTLNALMTAVQNKHDFSTNFRIIRKNGEQRFIKANGREVAPNEKGERIVLGTNQDVTGILKNDYELEELLDTLQNAQQTAKIGSWQYYPLTNTSVLDAVTKSIYGLPPDYEIAAEQGITYYKEGFSRDLVIQSFQNLLEKNIPYDIEVQMITAQGNEIWVRTIGKGKTNEKGEVIKASGVLQDITDVKEREIALIESTQLFEGAFNYSGIGMCLVGLDGTILQANERLVEYLGYSESELSNLKFQDFTYPDDLNEDLEYLERTIAGEIKTYSMDKRYICKDGSIFWASLNVSLIRDASGKPLYFVSQIQDINKRKKYERKLQQVNKNLMQMSDRLTSQNRSLSDFAHITSHNLRAPVANLMQLKDLYQGAEDVEEKDLIFEKIADSTDQLSDTLNHLIEALIIKERLDIELKYVDIEGILNRQLKKLKPNLDETGASISLDLEFNQLIANPVYLESIFFNLISNAIRYRKANTAPQIRVSSRIVERVPIIKIADNGRGIDLDRHGKKVFGLLKTFHGNPDAKGIGLFMVKTQVESMGGEVGVISSLKEGTTFVLSFKENTAII